MGNSTLHQNQRLHSKDGIFGHPPKDSTVGDGNGSEPRNSTKNGGTVLKQLLQERR